MHAYNIIIIVGVHYLYSAAKCLGARRVCQQAYQWLSKHNIISCVVEYRQAASACLQFAGEWTVNIVNSLYIQLSCLFNGRTFTVLLQIMITLV